MSKFCIYCGKSLLDNERCDCRTASGAQEGGNAQQSYGQYTQETQSEPRQPHVQGVFSAKVATLFKRSLGLIMRYLKRPVHTMMNESEDAQMADGLVYAGLLALSAGVSAVMILKNVMGGFMTGMGRIFGSGNSGNLREFGDFGGFGNFGDFGGFAPRRMGLPYGWIFLQLVLLALLVYFVLSGTVWFLGRYAFKGSGRFGHVVRDMGIASLNITAAFLCAGVLSYIVPQLSGFIVCAGVLASLLMSLFAVRKSLRLDWDRCVYLLAVSYVTCGLVLYILFAQNLHLLG